MFNYMTASSKFWLALLGHEAVSVGSYVEQIKTLVGSVRSIESILHIREMAALDKLAACGMVSLKEEKRPKSKVMAATWLGWQPVPDIRLFCYLIADMMDRGLINRKASALLSWGHLFNKVLDSSTSTERAGVGLISTVEICLPSKGVKQSNPYIIVNGNQRATASGFQTLSSRENYTVLYSADIGVPSKMVGTIMLESVEDEEEEHKNPFDVSWADTPVNEWNSCHLVNWIYDKLVETYGDSPYSRKVMMEFGVKTEGINGLDRLQKSPAACPMAEYKDYIEWLFNHSRLQVTPSNMTSSRIMLEHLVDKVNPKKKDGWAPPEAFRVE